MSEAWITAIVTVLATGGAAGSIVNWLKDRKKDDASAMLTNVEALQKQVVLLTDITTYLRKENAALRVDCDTEQERNRQLRIHLTEVEEELQHVRRSANQTQEQCNKLSEKLRQLAADEDGRTR